MRDTKLSPHPLGEFVWDLELFSALDMLTLIENAFFTSLYSPADVLRLRGKLELAAW